MIVSLVGSIVLVLIIVLYLLLVLGLPYGEYAMGGSDKIPSRKIRIMSVFAILIQFIGMLCLLQGGDIINVGFPDKILKIVCYIYAIYLSLNVFMNIASRSKKERIIMTPLSAIIAICFWITAISL